MPGFNIEYRHANYDEDSISDNIYSDSTTEEWKDWLNTQYKDITAWLQEDKIINICHIDFWGNRNEGYDFNDILSRKEINNIQEFIEYWNKETQKLIDIE